MIELRHIVRATPHGAGLRKRMGRLLRPVRPSHKVELWYKAELLGIVKVLRKISREELLPELQVMAPLYADDQFLRVGNMVADRLPRRSLDRTFLRMAQRVGGIGTTAQRLASLAAERSASEVDSRLKASIRASVGIDITGVLHKSGPIAEAMRAATVANVDLIKSIPEQYFEKIGQVVSDGMEAGLRFETLAKEVERIGDVTESRAKLIARDQISKMNGAFNRVRQTSLGITQYVWQTSGDERVRPTHADQDGKLFSWNDPPGETGHPGHDVNCRCVAIPHFDLDKEEELLGL